MMSGCLKVLFCSSQLPRRVQQRVCFREEVCDRGHSDSHADALFVIVIAKDLIFVQTGVVTPMFVHLKERMAFGLPLAQSDLSLG
jgi:hypothetical protein